MVARQRVHIRQYFIIAPIKYQTKHFMGGNHNTIKIYLNTRKTEIEYLLIWLHRAYEAEESVY
ncbi:MAG: hypothetical protein CVV23_05515 [Ignavibacteriae bacterium HGW-Ignavibacteriae-2]|nr:MAG: hypothetical protein CVV23_05515 [Ignavibacteriae bacterium HGW-Ignavibacteriae-2]